MLQVASYYEVLREINTA